MPRPAGVSTVLKTVRCCSATSETTSSGTAVPYASQNTSMRRAAVWRARVAQPADALLVVTKWCHVLERIGDVEERWGRSSVVPVDEPGDVVAPPDAVPGPEIAVAHDFSVRAGSSPARPDAPVVLDLRGLDVMLTRRFIDFSSGLTYGLKATAERMFDGVFLLQPKDIRLDDHQRKVISDQL